ncbi:MAG: glutamine--fructose-6-phosphate transaminase (isomerizing) [Desulfuromonadia bacterium]
MCGIVGYIGFREATPIILEGLKRLEYRGYDSAGICTINSGCADIVRSQGKLVNLERKLAETPLTGTIGIGHTRWATHGRPSEANAHPHQAGSIIVVHNGIIENYRELKEMLTHGGRVFTSETDTEVISHLIDHHYVKTGSFEEGVRRALSELTGAFALCILCRRDPDVMIAAKKGSPLVIGLGEKEWFVASDIPAILSHTREMVFMDDGEMVLFRDGAVTFSRIDGDLVEKSPRHIDWSPLMAEKGGYRHFMLKEIFEQPRAIRDTLTGRLDAERGDAILDEISLSDSDLAAIDRIVIIACGTSWHAGLVGKFLIEDLCRIPTEVDIASEFRYRNPVIDDKTLLLLISQSGETADTLAALREGKRQGGKNIAICNVVDSSIAREADGVIYTHAGPEIGVASTKAFTTQLVALQLFALHLANRRGTIDPQRARGIVRALLHASAVVEEALSLNPLVERIARTYMNSRDFLYLGRGMGYPIALEGALKLKEISYIHAEGYPAGEMKHGPIALIDEEMPVVMLAPRDRHYDKVVSNMEEVIARGGRVIAVVTKGDDRITGKGEAVMDVPEVPEEILPIVLSIPLQLLAYHIAVMKGTDVDQPRNLAKSVTVE